LSLLIKTLLYTYSFLVFDLCFADLIKKDYLSQKNFSGTPKREEFEFKFASVFPENLDLKKVQNEIHKTLNFLIKENTFQFDKQVFQKYYNDLKMQSFVFKDIYLDTAKFDLFNNNSVYRLRHRWVHEEKYFRHRILPFLKVFYPDRCEIQYKYGYLKDDIEQTVKVFETRFEFRDESRPFGRRNKAPIAPWPEEEYLKYATDGRYKDYHILPMRDLLENTKSIDEKLDLKPVAKIITTRYRTHLNVKHPWGYGPNPEQVFIVTLDISRGISLSSRPVNKAVFLELEVEIDRNTSEQLNKASGLKAAAKSLKLSIQNFSRQGQNNLRKDLAIIRKNLIKLLKNKFKLEPLPVNNKYARFLAKD